MSSPSVLLLPGWQNSGAAHWQSRWEALHGHRRVAQHDWMRPLRGDWMARLDEEVLAASNSPTPPDSSATQAPPLLLVAHSLGCLLVAAWAAHSRHTASVAAALLVAPGDAEREDLPALHSWRPIERRRLPFPAVLLGSRNDPYCAFDKAQALAQAWGAHFIDCGAAGHINADSGLGDWPQGHALLHQLTQAAQAPPLTGLPSELRLQTTPTHPGPA